MVASAHDELDLLAELIRDELCMTSLPYLTPFGCRCSMLQVPCMPQVRIKGLKRTGLQGWSVLDIFCWLSCSLPAVLFLGVNNASTVQPVVSISLSRQQSSRPGLLLFMLGRAVVRCRHPRSELSSTERGRQVRWRLAIKQPSNKQSSAMCSQAAVPSCHSARVLQGCMRCCPIHRLRCAVCNSFPARAAGVIFAESAVLCYVLQCDIEIPWVSQLSAFTDIQPSDAGCWQPHVSLSLICLSYLQVLIQSALYTGIVYSMVHFEWAANKFFWCVIAFPAVAEHTQVGPGRMVSVLQVPGFPFLAAPLLHLLW